MLALGRGGSACPNMCLAHQALLLPCFFKCVSLCLQFIHVAAVCTLHLPITIRHFHGVTSRDHHRCLELLLLKADSFCPKAKDYPTQYQELILISLPVKKINTWSASFTCLSWLNVNWSDKLPAAVSVAAFWDASFVLHLNTDSCYC